MKVRDNGVRDIHSKDNSEFVEKDEITKLKKKCKN